MKPAHNKSLCYTLYVQVQQFIQHRAYEKTLDQVVQLQTRKIEQLNMQLLNTTKQV